MMASSKGPKSSNDGIKQNAMVAFLLDQVDLKPLNYLYHPPVKQQRHCCGRSRLVNASSVSRTGKATKKPTTALPHMPHSTDVSV